MAELGAGEPHPSAHDALEWIRARASVAELMRWEEAFASAALSGSRLGEICAGTVRRLIAGEPVSDRYVLGLAWAMRFSECAPHAPKT